MMSRIRLRRDSLGNPAAGLVATGTRSWIGDVEQALPRAPRPDRARRGSTPGAAEPQSFEGQWALPRLFARLRSEAGSTPDRALVTFNVLNRRARFEVKSPTHSNPVRLTALEQFQCPQRL